MSDEVSENAPDSSEISMRRGMMAVIETQIVTAVIVAVLMGVLLPNALRRDVWAGLTVVLAAMLVGFVPLRVLLRSGPDNIVAGWIAAMMLRMAATLIGLVLLIKKYRLDLGPCVWTVCGGYLLLLAVETIGMIRLIRRQFDQQAAGRSGEAIEGVSGAR